MAFSGLPIEGIEFYEQLSADNSRSFWQANKGRFDEFVKQPMAELTEELADFGPFHMFRPYNDVRFSKNKPPYKTAQGAYGESEGGAGHYVQFSATGLMVGAGYYAMAKDQLERFRQGIDADATGAELAELVADAERRKYSISAIDSLKTAPRLPEGSPPHRAAAPQGPDRRAGVRDPEVDPHEGGRQAHPSVVGRCRRPLRLARRPRRPQHPPARRPPLLTYEMCQVHLVRRRGTVDLLTECQA